MALSRAACSRAGILGIRDRNGFLKVAPGGTFCKLQLLLLEPGLRALPSLQTRRPHAKVAQFARVFAEAALTRIAAQAETVTQAQSSAWRRRALLVEGAAAALEEPGRSHPSRYRVGGWRGLCNTLTPAFQRYWSSGGGGVKSCTSSKA